MNNYAIYLFIQRRYRLYAFKYNKIAVGVLTKLLIVFKETLLTKK